APALEGAARPGLAAVSSFTVRALDPADTRPLRHAILRPHQPIGALAAHETAGSFAVGAFAGEELVSVGLVGPTSEPRAWRVRGMATAPHARGRGAASAVLEALLSHAAAQEAERVWASVRTPARSLYERAA